jgi:hypothetical protein
LIQQVAKTQQPDVHQLREYRVEPCIASQRDVLLKVGKPVPDVPVDEICQFPAVDRTNLQNMVQIMQWQHQMVIEPAASLEDWLPADRMVGVEPDRLAGQGTQAVVETDRGVIGGQSVDRLLQRVGPSYAK